jgi:hypothetical protein
MNFRNLLIFILTLIGIDLNAQGFDWQYSSRMPFKSPNLFLGLNIGTGITEYNGTVQLKESSSATTASNLCCEFKNGNGNNSLAGIRLEYWFQPNYAFFSNLSYNLYQANFTNTESLPRKKDNLVTEYKYSANLSYLIFAVGAKWKLPNYHFNVSAGINTSILILNNATYTETVISPAWEWQQRNLTLGSISELNTIIINPTLNFGYDFSIGMGNYITPNLIFDFPVMNTAKGVNWSRWNMNFGISYMRGIN